LIRHEAGLDEHDWKVAYDLIEGKLWKWVRRNGQEYADRILAEVRSVRSKATAQPDSLPRPNPKRRRGPKPGSGRINETNKWDALEFLIKKGSELPEQQHTKHQVAAACQGEYGISGRSKLAAEKAIDRLLEICDHQNWTKDILPRMKQTK
jgi:hypothetical protein